MEFAAQPDNDFEAFYHIYFARCRARCPKLCVLAAKWSFEDLIPGLSDFDGRFVVEDGITLQEWHTYSLAVGQVHTEMAFEFPRWVRCLEHPPGLNLTLREITDPRLYCTEFKQWTFYTGDSRALSTIRTYLDLRAWSVQDEIYHLKRVATYFGPYVRGIDPPINIGPWQNKYPMHSRTMHYFTPAVQAMASLALRRTVRGKREALRLARELFPNPSTIDRIFDRLDRHYEIAGDYEEPRLTEIEREMERYLAQAWASLADQVTQIAVSDRDTRDDIRRKVAAMPVDPMEAFYEGLKFARLLQGRLLFYASDIAGFDSIWLIRNELGRIVSSFYEQPLKAYGSLRFGKDLSPLQVLDRLRGELLTPAECDGMAAFAQAVGAPPAAGQEKQQARAVAAVYEPVLTTLEKLSDDLRPLLHRETDA